MLKHSLGSLVKEEGLTLYYKTTSPYGYVPEPEKIKNVEIRFFDSRKIKPEQRAKIYATLKDIADHTGYMPEELKQIMKYMYIGKTGEEYFSLSDCSVTTARHFINHLLDFALDWDIPLIDNIINRTDDTSATIYSSLKHRRCITCGKEGETVTWGFHKKLCLCPVCQEKARQIGQKAFEKLHHVYGIALKE